MALAISVGVRPSFFLAAVSFLGVMGSILASDALRGHLRHDSGLSWIVGYREEGGE